jgi:hypothetical protein
MPALAVLTALSFAETTLAHPWLTMVTWALCAPPLKLYGQLFEGIRATLIEGVNGEIRAFFEARQARRMRPR